MLPHPYALRKALKLLPHILFEKVQNKQKEQSITSITLS